MLLLRITSLIVAANASVVRFSVSPDEVEMDEDFAVTVRVGEEMALCKLNMGSVDSYIEYSEWVTPDPNPVSSRHPLSGQLGLGAGPRDHENDWVDFATFRDYRGRMKVLFSSDIRNHLQKMQSELCLQGPLAVVQSAGSSRYVVSGQVAVENVSPSGPLLIQLESIHNYIEVPRDIYEKFISLLAAKDMVDSEQPSTENVVLRNCRREGGLPLIDFMFAKNTHFEIPAWDYLIPGPNDTCTLLVRPAKEATNFIVAGLPVLRNAVLAAHRTTQGGVELAICNGDRRRLMVADMS